MVRLALAMALGGLCLAGDLDLAIPPGTPLEWNQSLRRPIPTGAGKRDPAATPPTKPKEPGTQTEERPTAPPALPPSADFFAERLYDRFLVTTTDIMGHISNPLPKSTGEVTQDDVATGGGAMAEWNYPPAIPTELYWSGGAILLRRLLHPEVVPWPEAAAALVELGEPARYACDMMNGNQLTKGMSWWNEIVDRIGDVPRDLPAVPASKDPKEALLFRICAIELTSGFPGSIDPTFARRTLSLGDEAYPAIRACAKVRHSLLSRNAVSLLVHHPSPDAPRDLIELLKDVKDDVVKARVLLGLARRSAKEVAPLLTREAEGVDSMWRAIGMHGLGLLGDPGNAKPLVDAAKGADVGDTDLMWTVVPALTRLKTGREPLLALDAKLMKKLRGNDVVRLRRGTSIPEDNQAAMKVVRQMILVALARMGEKKHADEVVLRMDRVGIESFYPTVMPLLVTTLGELAAGLPVLKKRLLDDKTTAVWLKQAALDALDRANALDAAALRAIAEDEKTSVQIRAQALSLLAARDSDAAGRICAQAVTDWVDKKGATTLAQAWWTFSAVRTGGPAGAIDLPSLVAAADRAFETRAFGRREGGNTLDLSKSNVTLFPPLLESLLLELGRKASTDALPVLARVRASTVVPGRAEAVIAAGSIAGAEADRFLVEALDDSDGWVRWRAWHSLVARGAPDHFCDWVFGDKGKRRTSVEAYRKWAGMK